MSDIINNTTASPTSINNCVPGGCPTGYRAATVINNQTFTDLLVDNNVSYSALRVANPTLSTTRIAPGTNYCVPPSGTRRLCPNGASSYVMGPDESLQTLVISKQTTPGALLEANPMLAPGDFVPGRVICLPG